MSLGTRVPDFEIGDCNATLELHTQDLVRLPKAKRHAIAMHQLSILL